MREPAAQVTDESLREIHELHGHARRVHGLSDEQEKGHCEQREVVEPYPDSLRHNGEWHIAGACDGEGGGQEHAEGDGHAQQAQQRK
jgi:hypothetical protein